MNKLYREHHTLSKSLKFFNLVNAISEGFDAIAITRKARDGVKDVLHQVGLGEAASTIFPAVNWELLVAPSRALAVVLKMLMPEPKERIVEIAVIYDHDENLTALLEILHKLPELGECTLGTSYEARRLSTLRKTLASVSPNGRKLANPSMRGILPKLYNPNVRLIVKEGGSAYLQEAVTHTMLERLEGLAKSGEVLKTAIKDKDLFAERYTIGCPACGVALSFLIYATAKAAKEALRTTEVTQCPMCQAKGPLEVVACYRLESLAREGVEQGLWLEHLVEETLKQECLEVFAGRMAGPHELDIVAVFCERIFLAECSDSTFGHNDLMVLAGKASDMGADEVVVVTTKQLHQNVRELAERYNKRAETPGFRRMWRERGALRFHLVEAESETDIANKLKGILNHTQREWIQSQMYSALGRRFMGAHEPYEYEGWYSEE